MLTRGFMSLCWRFSLYKIYLLIFLVLTFLTFFFKRKYYLKAKRHLTWHFKIPQRKSSISSMHHLILTATHLSVWMFSRQSIATECWRTLKCSGTEGLSVRSTHGCQIWLSFWVCRVRFWLIWKSVSVKSTQASFGQVSTHGFDSRLAHSGREDITNLVTGGQLLVLD